MMDTTSQHEKMLYPTVRVRTDKSGGSGTIIYSQPVNICSGIYETYVLTNCHVIDSNIKVTKKWSTLLKREVKTDILSDCTVELFEFEYGSWQAGHASYNAEIMCYDKDMDLALLRVKSERKFDYVATLLQKDTHKEKLRMFQETFAIGCGMGHPPLATKGHITGFTDIIENYPYFMSTSPTVFGNSGGACYLAETGEFIGIPSRITVNLSGFGSDAITHMMYFIPMPSIYSFLDDQIFMFLYDDKHTSEECYNRRKQLREKDEYKMAIDISRHEENGDERKQGWWGHDK